jgi:hypothetical protein
VFEIIKRLVEYFLHRVAREIEVEIARLRTKSVGYLHMLFFIVEC